MKWYAPPRYGNCPCLCHVNPDIIHYSNQTACCNPTRDANGFKIQPKPRYYGYKKPTRNTDGTKIISVVKREVKS